MVESVVTSQRMFGDVLVNRNPGAGLGLHILLLQGVVSVLAMVRMGALEMF
jgi:hypothetical protein